MPRIDTAMVDDGSNMAVLQVMNITMCTNNNDVVTGKILMDETKRSVKMLDLKEV
jgi:hypothetical protein